MTWLRVYSDSGSSEKYLSISFLFICSLCSLGTSIIISWAPSMLVSSSLPATIISWTLCRFLTYIKLSRSILQSSTLPAGLFFLLLRTLLSSWSINTSSPRDSSSESIPSAAVLPLLYFIRAMAEAVYWERYGWSSYCREEVLLSTNWAFVKIWRILSVSYMKATGCWLRTWGLGRALKVCKNLRAWYFRASIV